MGHMGLRAQVAVLLARRHYLGRNPCTPVPAVENNALDSHCPHNSKTLTLEQSHLSALGPSVKSHNFSRLFSFIKRGLSPPPPLYLMSIQMVTMIPIWIYSNQAFGLVYHCTLPSFFFVDHFVVGQYASRTAYSVESLVTGSTELVGIQFSSSTNPRHTLPVVGLTLTW